MSGAGDGGTDGGEVADAEIREAVAQLDEVRAEWLRLPWVAGTDIGLRRGGEGLTIRVYVDRKLLQEGTAPEAMLPERLARFPVEVVDASFGPEG